jgi:hypothetical protein
MLGVTIAALMSLFNVGFPAQVRSFEFDFCSWNLGCIANGKSLISFVGRDDLDNAASVQNIGSIPFSIGDARCQERKIIVPIDRRLTTNHWLWSRIHNYSCCVVWEDNTGVCKCRIELPGLGVGATARVGDTGDFRCNKNFDLSASNDCGGNIEADRWLMPYVLESVTYLGGGLPAGEQQRINSYRFNLNPRTLLSLRFFQGSAENPPLREANYDRSESEEGYSNGSRGGTSARPILGVFILSLGLPFFIVALKIADAPYKPIAIASFGLGCGIVGALAIIQGGILALVGVWLL